MVLLLKSWNGVYGPIGGVAGVVTEGKTIEECRDLLKDAVHKMVIAYRQQGKEIPIGGALFEQVPVEV